MTEHSPALRDALAILEALTRAEHTAIRQRQQAMVTARCAGASWVELGTASGCPRDTARTRYEAARRDLDLSPDHCTDQP